MKKKIKLLMFLIITKFSKTGIKIIKNTFDKYILPTEDLEDLIN